MIKRRLGILAAGLVALLGFEAIADDSVPVTVDNFIRAESDMYLAGVALNRVASAGSS